VIPVSGAAGCQMLGITTQGACVFAMVWCRGFSAVSLNIVHNADRLVLVGKELVVFPHTNNRAFQTAGVSRGTSVCSVAINSTSEAEGRLFTFTLLWRFIVRGIAWG